MYCDDKKCGDKDCKLKEVHWIHQCAIRKALQVLWAKRPIPILVCLQTPRRFGELKRWVKDISEKMLIQTLRQLETHNFVKRKDFKTLPPKVKYSLTKKGKESLDLVPLLVRIGNTIHLDI